MSFFSSMMRTAAKLALAVVGAIAGAIVGFMVGGAFGAVIGFAVGLKAGLMAGDALGNALFPRHTDPNVQKVNTRIAESLRTIAAGEVMLGGAVVFGEFASDGDLWYIIVHCDSPLAEVSGYYLDGVEVTVDYTGAVLTKDFRLNGKNEAVTSDGAGDTHIWLYTGTYTPDNPVPVFPSAEFQLFFSQWTSEHLLVGTTFTVVHCLGMSEDVRYKWYKWRGPLQLGEPSVSIVGKFSYCYDPRDSEQVLGDPSTYKFTRNASLVWAWFRTHRYGRNKPESSINWDRVAEQADICDETVVGVYSSQPRYQCDVTASDGDTRGDVETGILMSMDGQIVYDDDGKSWVRVGKYVAPTLSLSRNRDIVGMESVEAIDGESGIQGIIVRYTDPDAKYSLQPSAAWTNPLYYVEGDVGNFTTIDIPEIQNHNQAMRVAKAMGMRVQPVHKLGPTTSLRGLRAVRERFVNLNYDNTFAGDYEIASQVELDDNGVFCQMVLVPVDEDRWVLLTGEEKPKPVIADADTLGAPASPSGVTLQYVNSRIEARFTTAARKDVKYRFLYTPTASVGDEEWSEMTVDMLTNFAYSGPVAENVGYTVRYSAHSPSGLVSAATDTTLNTVPPLLDSTEFSAFVEVPGSGIVTLSWRNSVSATFTSVDIYHGTTTAFGSATIVVDDLAGGLGEYVGIDDTRTAGTHYYWIVTNGVSGSNPPQGPVSVVVT